MTAHPGHGLSGDFEREETASTCARSLCQDPTQGGRTCTRYTCHLMRGLRVGGWETSPQAHSSGPKPHAHPSPG